METHEEHDVPTGPAKDDIADDGLTQMTYIATEIKSLKSGPKKAADRQNQIGTVMIGDLMSIDPTLDPNNADFDVYKWIKTVMLTANSRGVKFRLASFSFKNLTVDGTVSKTKTKENVLSALFPAALFSWVRNRSPKKQRILDDCHGVVNPGEMLMVVGRKGSGSSTFLKTIAGEMHGLKLGPGSILHYNGK